MRPACKWFWKIQLINQRINQRGGINETLGWDREVRAVKMKRKNNRRQTSVTEHPNSSRCSAAVRIAEVTPISTPSSRVSRIRPIFNPFRGFDCRELVESK